MALKKTVKYLFPAVFLLFLVLPAGYSHSGPAANINSAAENKIIRRWITTGTHSKAVFPSDYLPPKPLSVNISGDHFLFRLFSRRFAQGDIVYAEIIPAKDSAFPADFRVNTVTWGGRNLRFTVKDWGVRILFAIHPEESSSSPALTVHYTADGAARNFSYNIKIKKTDFPVFTSALNLGSYSNAAAAAKPEIQKRIQEDREIKNRVFSVSASEDFITGRFSHPRDYHYITSRFYAKRRKEVYRIVNGKKVFGTPSEHVHRGTDFRGIPGDPIYAHADGKIVLARDMYYEGKFTVIDHGNCIYTLIMHQNDFTVKEGDSVEAGQLIGRVGATGAVTGSHLHLGIYVQGVVADPESLWILPVRE